MISPSLVARLCRARKLLQEPRATVRVEEAARAAALSPYHFIRLFKATFGCTPHQVLVEARLQRAKQLLHADDLSVTQVCMEVGFASLGSFSSLFTRRVGVSPAAYRRRVRKHGSPAPGCYSLMWGWPEPQLSRSVASVELPQSQA